MKTLLVALACSSVIGCASSSSDVLEDDSENTGVAVEALTVSCVCTEFVKVFSGAGQSGTTLANFSKLSGVFGSMDSVACKTLCTSYQRSVAKGACTTYRGVSVSSAATYDSAGHALPTLLAECSAL